MPWYISIILGFVFIGVGVTTWINGNTIEKRYTNKEVVYVNHNNEIIQTRIHEYILENYKLTPKDNKSINSDG